MPHADFMPTVVFPKTSLGESEWQSWEKSSHTVPYFCDEYQKDPFYLGICKRRDVSGNRHKNLCFRCVAGFLYDMSYHLNLGEVQDMNDRARIEAL